MTATDMHMMRRLGAPSVSPDGRYAVFTLSTTDLAANKRNNVAPSPRPEGQGRGAAAARRR